jgi:hypothetical protein
MTKVKFFELAGKIIADHYNRHTKGKKIIDPEKSIELISFDTIGENIKAVTAVNMSDIDDDNWEENFVYYTIEFIEDGQFFKMDVSKFVDSITIPYLNKKELKSIDNIGLTKDIKDKLEETVNDLIESLQCKEVKKDYNLSNTINEAIKKIEKEEKRKNIPKEKVKYESEFEDLYDFVKTVYEILNIDFNEKNK